METKIVKIGNSKGIRLPKAVLEQCGFNDGVTIQVKDKKLIISSRKKSREGWAKEFEKLTRDQKKTKDDLRTIRGFTTQWEKDEWEW
jgi:antitoxin MazE